MNNVYSLLHENVNRHHKKLFYDLDNSLALAIAKYNVDLNDRQARSVFNSLSNLTTSRYVATDTLCSNGIYALHREKPAPELKALRATLADDPRRVLISLHRRLAKNDVDLGDPKALAAFKAATELLGHFVQLEHDYIKTYLEEAQSHLRLRRARRRQQTIELSQPKQESPQEAEGTP